MIRYDEHGKVDEIVTDHAQFEMLSDQSAMLRIGDSHVTLVAIGGKLKVVVLEGNRE